MSEHHSTQYNNNHRFTWTATLVLISVLGTLVGCGGKPASVNGVITIDGKPLHRGTIAFKPAAGGMMASGSISEDGTYSLQTNRESGLDIGQYQITISAREPGREDPNGGPPMPGPYITPRRYSVASTSGLQAEVIKGSNVIDLDLSSDGLEADNKPRRRRR